MVGAASESTLAVRSECRWPGLHVTVALSKAVGLPSLLLPESDPTFPPFPSFQDKQNEASYLRDHKEELTEELATTILQRVGQFKRPRPRPRAGEMESKLTKWTHLLMPCPELRKQKEASCGAHPGCCPCPAHMYFQRSKSLGRTQGQGLGEGGFPMHGKTYRDT